MIYKNIKIALWNANGLANHILEITYFLQKEKIDILLVSETHCTHKSYIKIPHYNCYHSVHPDGKAHGGSAILIKENIKHYAEQSLSTAEIQAAMITVEHHSNPLVLAAVYCPPRHRIHRDMFLRFLTMLGPKFVAGGDYNAKHLNYGSRVTTPRGTSLYQAASMCHCEFLTTGEPTYWPADQNRIPDLLDIFVVKGISSNYLRISPCYDLISDHSAVIVTIGTEIMTMDENKLIHTKNTNWECYRQVIDEQINLNILLKSPKKC